MKAGRAIIARSAISAASVARICHAPAMFAVTEAEATAIRDAYQQRGEFAAAIELRRIFPGIADNRQARVCVRMIAGWKPLPLRPVRPRVRRAAATVPLAPRRPPEP